MPRLMNVFKMFSCYFYWSRIVSLIVSITFTSSIISPAFASTANVSEVNKVLEGDQCPAVDLSDITHRFYNLNLSDNSIPVVFDKEIPSFGVLGWIKEKGGYTLYLLRLTHPMSDGAKESFKNDLKYITRDAEFWADYVDEMRPIAVKEFISKCVGKGAAGRIFDIGLLKASYPLMEAFGFFMRNIAEIPRDIRGLIKEAIKEDDRKKVGKIVRNSLTQHVLPWVINMGIGFNVEHICNAIGVPKEVSEIVGCYSKWNSVFSPISEISGRTGEVILAAGGKELPWMGSLYNIILQYGFYYIISALSNVRGDYNSELSTVAMWLMTKFTFELVGAISRVAYVYFDDRFTEFDLFSCGDDGIIDCFFDWELQKTIFSNGWSTAIGQFATTIAGFFDRSSVALFGTKSLSFKKDLDKVARKVNILGAAGAKTSKILTINSMVANETVAEIRRKMRLGMAVNGVLASPYFVTFAAPNLLTDDVDEQDLVRFASGSNYVANGERVARSELEALMNPSWVKLFGDIMKVSTVLVFGVLLYKFKQITIQVEEMDNIGKDEKRAEVNRIMAAYMPVYNIITYLTFASAAAYFYSAFTYGWSGDVENVEEENLALEGVVDDVKAVESGLEDIDQVETEL